MALYSRKIRVKGGYQTIWDSSQTGFKCRKLAFHSFRNPSMRMQSLSVCTHTCVCVCTPKCFCGLSFPKIVYFLQKQVIFSIKTFFKSIFIWLGSKPNLGLKVLTSSENGSASRKRYKIRRLQSFPQTVPNWWCIWSSIELFV